MSSKGSKPQDSRSSGQEKSKERKSDWSALGLLADTIDGFFSWSFTIQLPGTLFFFPCVKMAWSGSEVALCAGILAIFLAFTRIRWWTLRYYWFFRLLALTIGILSKYADPVEYQILVLGLANGLEWLSIFGFWRSSSSERRSQSVLGFMLGFVAFVCISMAYRSLNPIWEFELANYIALGVALFSVLLHFFIESPKDYSQAVITPSTTAPHSLPTGLGLGALCFLTCNYMAGHGIISRWVELPTFPHGSIVIATTILGIFLSFVLAGFVQSWVWWAMTGLAGWVLLCSGVSHGQEHRIYIEFAGGLLLVLYGASSWNIAIDQFSKVNRPGTTMFVTVLTMTVLNVWGVYVVAYKFVPGGEILRERNISLTFLTVVLSALITARVAFYAKQTTLSFVKVFLPIVLISALVFAPSHFYRVQRSLSNPTTDPSPDSLRAMIWATHFGYDNNGGINMQELAKTMKDAKVNVVGLVETDCSRAFFSNRDVVEFVSEELGFYSDYGPSTATNTWGCALLSAYPILRSDRIILPSPEGELACLIDADLLVNGTSVNVLVTHFGNTEDELDRKLQADAVMEMARSKKDKYTPTILIGYLTSAPYTNYYPPLIESGWRDSLNSLDRYCEYILYKDMKVQNFERIDKGNISDTEAQVGTFLIEPIAEYDARWSRTPTPQFCRSIGTDSVACQREVHCGWCQYGTQGVCLEREMKQVCENFQGIFLGEKVEKNIEVTEQSRKDFVSLFYEGQLNGLYPLKKIDGNTWEWTINDFNYLRSYVRSHTSSPFEWEGQLWRLNAQLPNPKWNPSDAYLDVALESLDAKKYQGLVTVSFNLKTVGTGEIKNIGTISESRNAFRTPKRSRRVTSVDLVQNHFYTNEADFVKIQVNLKLQ